MEKDYEPTNLNFDLFSSFLNNQDKREFSFLDSEEDFGLYKINKPSNFLSSTSQSQCSQTKSKANLSTIINTSDSISSQNNTPCNSNAHGQKEFLTRQIRTIQCILNHNERENYIGRKRSHRKDSQNERTINELNEIDLTDDEDEDEQILKKKLRKLKNRIAARKSRDKKRSQITQIELENRLLKQENEKLKRVNSAFSGTDCFDRV